MKRIITALAVVIAVAALGFGQNSQTTKNTADQRLRSSGRVNPSTLGMQFDLPIGSYSGRGFDLPLGLSYSSKVWKFEDEHSIPAGGGWPTRSYAYAIYSEDAAAGWTSSLAQPYIEYTGLLRTFDAYGRPIPLGGNYNGADGYKYVKRINVFLPGGESHELRASNSPVNGSPSSSDFEGNFYSTDGSGLRYYQATGSGIFRLYLPNGSFYDFNSSTESHGWNTSSLIRRGNRLTDTNGNYVQYNAPNTQEDIYDPYGSWTDQLGRTFPVMIPLVTPKTGSVVEDEFTLPGMTNSYTLVWRRLSSVFAKNTYVTRYVGGSAGNSYEEPAYGSGTALFSGGFGVVESACGASGNLYIWVTNFENLSDPITKFDPLVLAEIQLPNSAMYYFKYNEWGEIERVDYPAGGHEEFDYDPVASLAGLPTGYQESNRGVTESRVYENNSDTTPLTSYYSAAVSDNNYRTSVISPDGMQTDNFMHRGLKPGCDSNVGSYEYGGLRYGYDSALAGRTYETRVFSADSTPHIVQRTLTKWDYSEDTNVTVRGSGSPKLQYNARVFSTLGIGYDGSNKLATITKLEYDTDKDDLGSPLNVVAKKEYSYTAVTDSNSYSPATSSDLPPSGVVTLSDPTSGLTPVRITQTTYKTETAYRNRNILKLPTQVLVTDGASTPSIKAKTEISYDDGDYLVADSTTGTVPGWSTPEASPSPVVRGLATSTKSWYDPADSNAFVTSHVQYNQFGSPRKTWDGNNNVSEIQYEDNFSDSSDHHTYAFATKAISAVPGGNGSTSQFETHIKYQFLSGLPVSSTDLNGQVTTMAYEDALLRPTLVTAPNGQQTITQYGDGTSASTRWVKVKSQIDDDGEYDYSTWKESTSWYDGLMRTIRLQSKDDESGDAFTLTCYDTAGRVSKVSNPFRGYTSQNCSTTTGMDWTTNTFDSVGRVWKITAPDTSVVETNYSLITSGSQIGTAVTVTDQAGKLRRSITNALGHLIRVDEPGPSTQLDDSGTPTQPTNYTYDLLNNLLTVTQASTTTQQCGGSSSCTQTRTFTYDALSHLLSAANPESGTIQYTYDANGNLTSKKDARNITTTYTYDALNRVTQLSYATPTATPTPGTYQNSPTVTYYYDGANVSGGIANSKGKLTKVTSSISTTEYTSFDILGHVTASKQTTDGGASGGYTMGYIYNLSGGLTHEIYPSGRVVKNVLYTNGDLSIVESKKNSSSGYWHYADGFTYSPSGALTSMQLGNGRWEYTHFNSRLQPDKIYVGKVQNGYDLLKLDYTYSTSGNHNNNGNILTQTITVPNSPDQTNGFTAVQSYTYDELNRIKSATETVSSSQTWKQTFDYDRYGNRKFDQANTSIPTSFANTAVTNPTINTSNNRITSSGWGYDAAGNTLTDANSQSYLYDGENEMVKASNGSGTLGEYFYDGDGKRVKKVAASDGGTTIFVYDAAGKLVAEYSYAVASAEDAKVAYLTNDHLGSPRINTDRDGNVISRHDYHPFGEESSTSQRTGHPDYTSDSVRKQFTGYERDSETDLDFAQARMYSKNLGRFTTTDPIYIAGDRLSDPQRMNLYSYVRNNPLLLVDPLGLDVTLNDKTKSGTGAEETTRMLNNRTKKAFDVGTDGKNKLVILGGNGEALGKKELKALEKTLTSKSEKELFRAVTDEKHHATMNVVGQDANVGFDRLDGKGENTVDLADMRSLNESSNAGGLTSGDATAHATLESFYTAEDSNYKGREEDKKRAHDKASSSFSGISPTGENPEFECSGCTRGGLDGTLTSMSENYNIAGRSGTMTVTKGLVPGIPRFNAVAADALGQKLETPGHIRNVTYKP